MQTQEVLLLVTLSGCRYYHKIRASFDDFEIYISGQSCDNFGFGLGLCICRTFKGSCGMKRR